jgi:glycosyltransferase involved in cell wall biosynthesis
MSPRPSFRDPESDGAGLAVVAEQCASFGGMERIGRLVLERWPAAELVAARFAAEAGPSLYAQARHVDLPGARVHHLAPLHGHRFRRRAGVLDSDLVFAMHSTGWGLAPRVAAGTAVVAFTNGIPRWLGPAGAMYLRGRRWPVRTAAAATAPLQRRHQQRLRARADVLLAPSRAAAATLDGPVRVLHSPVAVERFAGAGDPDGHVIVVARLVAHKPIEPLLAAMRGRSERLVVVGTGPQLERLTRAAPPNVTFTGHVSDDELVELLHGARVLVAPWAEEFGIAMGEAHAAGVPVIAPRAGGALDIVDDPRTGVLLDELTPRAIGGALDEVGFDPAACRESAARFGEERFLDELGAVFDEAVGLTAPVAAPVPA